MPLIQDTAMDDVTTPEPDAPPLLSPEQAEQLVLRTVATHAEALLRTARRHSLCLDDAHDAYQRSLEILMRRAPTLDPTRTGAWMHTVVKHEALAVRRSRMELVHPEHVDLDEEEAIHLASPEDHALSADRITAAAEALQRVKPQELRAMWLKALGKSYEEICAETGWSYTKVNRCLAEGRKSFLERFAGIRAGQECERWQPVLSAIVDGEADATQLAQVRPHLRNCSACRSTLRGLRESQRPLMAVLPVGLLSFSAKASGLVERLLPSAPVGEAVGAGGAGAFGIGTAKLASLLAAGVAATGGGIAVTEHQGSRHERAAKPEAQRVERVKQRPLGGRIVAARARATVTVPAHAAAAHPTAPRARTRSSPAPRRVAEASVRTREFQPPGIEPVRAAPAAAASAPRAPEPIAPASKPSKPPVTAAAPDASTGEFAPQP